MRIAIYICNYSIGLSVAIINTALYFAEQGVIVDIYSYNNVFDDRDAFNNENIHLHILTDPKNSKNHYISRARTALQGMIARMLPAALLEFRKDQTRKIYADDAALSSILPEGILERSLKIKDDYTYTAFIGVEPEGLIWAEHLGGGDDIPLIYWSLELYLGNDPRFRSPYYETVRKYAKMAHQKSIATIIQDEERAKLLAEQDHVPISNFILVPVAMKGAPVTEKSDYLYNMLNIPKDKKIIIYVGLITEERLSLETATAAEGLPEDWLMVLHGWCPDESYKKKIMAMQNKKFILSTNLLPFEQLVKIIASAHVGVSLYKATSDNERLSGAASSKTAQYLQCGLPVIVNDFESVRSIIRQYQHGICVDTPARIPDVLALINSQYDAMRRNAFKCYREKFEISPHLKKVMDILNTLDSGLLGKDAFQAEVSNN